MKITDKKIENNVKFNPLTPAVKNKIKFIFKDNAIKDYPNHKVEIEKKKIKILDKFINYKKGSFIFLSLNNYNDTRNFYMPIYMEHNEFALDSLRLKSVEESEELINADNQLNNKMLLSGYMTERLKSYIHKWYSPDKIQYNNRKDVFNKIRVISIGYRVYEIKKGQFVVRTIIQAINKGFSIVHSRRRLIRYVHFAINNGNIKMGEKTYSETYLVNKYPKLRSFLEEDGFEVTLSEL